MTVAHYLHSSLRLSTRWVYKERILPTFAHRNYLQAHNLHTYSLSSPHLHSTSQLASQATTHHPWTLSPRSTSPLSPRPPAGPSLTRQVATAAVGGVSSLASSRTSQYQPTGRPAALVAVVGVSSPRIDAQSSFDFRFSFTHVSRTALVSV